MILTIVAFVLILSVLVFVHELGHFLTARKFGVGAEEFGLGFPPRLCGWYRSKDGKRKFFWGNREVADAADTVYSLNLIPLGGFVKIKGEDGEDKTDATSFASKPIWKRTLILSAGVIMNVILAAVIISINLMVGAPQAIDNNQLPQNAIIGEHQVQVMEVIKGSPAEQAELRAGDRIISVDDEPLDSYSRLQEYVGDKAGQEVTYEISRGNETIEKKITPQVMGETGKAGIGISIAETASVRYPWYLAIVEGIKLTGVLLWAIITGLFELLRQALSGNGVSADVVGPVGIAALTGQMASLGFGYLMQFAALLSLHLAVINFVPFPALDGGRVLFLIIEKIKGSPIKPKTEAIIHNVGFMLLIAVILLVTFKDIVRLF